MLAAKTEEAKPVFPTNYSEYRVFQGLMPSLNGIFFGYREYSKTIQDYRWLGNLSRFEAHITFSQTLGTFPGKEPGSTLTPISVCVWQKLILTNPWYLVLAAITEEAKPFWPPFIADTGCTVGGSRITDGFVICPDLKFILLFHKPLVPPLAKNRGQR